MPRVSNPIAALRRFVRAHSGAVAIEFAIVAIPMLMLVMGVLELGMVLLVSTTLDTATDFASRDIRTGLFQQGGKVTAADFKAKVCKNMTWLASGCADRLTVEAQTFATFTNASASAPADPAAFDPQAPRCWSVGAPEDIVLVRAYYAWPLFTPLLSQALENGPNGKRLISSAKAFRNEPYSSDPRVNAKC
jgi:Flp pilus assembly protein TadG